ncbi:MAG: glycosyltransferase family 4 protein [Magnetococcales bacterium]|nr:glycosyltransferase family 4 protein [Magnetococcales bacterium]
MAIHATHTHKTVLILLPMLLVGGTEVQTLNMVRVLIAAGYRVTVCCFHEVDGGVVRQFEEAGSPVISMGLQRSKGLGLFFYFLKLLFRLVAIIRREKPQIIHVQYVAPGLVPIVAARLAGVKVLLATVHYPGRPHGWKAKMLLRGAARLCRAFFCVSQSVERSWFGDSLLFNPASVPRSRRHFTLYNGVDMAGIDRAVQKSQTQPPDILNGAVDQYPLIGVVGRLSYEKGQGVLLQAMVQIVERFPDTHLVVVGDGRDRESLQQKSQALALGQHVTWLGRQNLEEVLTRLPSFDLLVVPSLFEGFGLAAVEAMACGTPVVASKVDGLMEVIQDGVTGWLVPSGDAAALAEVMIAVLQNPEQRVKVGLAGQGWVRGNFSMERYEQSLLAAYHHFSSIK